MCIRDRVKAGSLINASVDLVMGSDVTAPIAIGEMEKYGFTQVFDPEKIVLVMDHFAPNKDIQAARNCALVRKFAEKMRISHFYDGGNMGIEHALLLSLIHIFYAFRAESNNACFFESAVYSLVYSFNYYCRLYFSILGF